MSATATLAEWIAAQGDQWSSRNLWEARRGWLDTMGVVLAGWDEPVTRSTWDAVRSWGAGPCWVVNGSQSGAPWAALVNGAAAHAIDYDDVLHPAMSHPSAALVPALLALAQQQGASGRACLDAYLVGIEVMTRLGEATNLVHYHAGWHTTLSLGAPGVAAACARLLGLDAHKTQMALGLSVSMAGGSKQQFGSMAKPLHAGLAAKNGLVAAQLAAAGVTAADEVFEGRWGYIMQTAGSQATGLQAVLHRLGNPPAIEQYGIWTKVYPCCASVHRPIDAVLDLARETGMGPHEVRTIDCYVSEMACANLRFHNPQTPAEARFSLPYCVATALLDGRVDMSSFKADCIHRPAVREIMSRIAMHADTELPGNAGIFDLQERARVEVRTNDGRSWTRTVVTPRGFSGNGISEDLLVRKFIDCEAGYLREESRDRVISMLGSFDTLADVRALSEPLMGRSLGLHSAPA